jgi:hypothetical protein
MTVSLLAAICLLAAVQIRPFSEERQLLDRRLETLRRILPDGPQAYSDVALVNGLARETNLTAAQVQARPPVSGTDHGEIVLDVSALGRYVEIDRFLRQVALSHRLVDLESLRLSATLHDTVSMACVLRLPYWPETAALPAPPDGAQAVVRGLPRGTAQAFLRGQALALGKSAAIERLRRAQRNPRLFLSELAAATRERPVTLTFASLTDEFLVRGLTVGEGSARALETRFERGFFRVSEFLMARDGACRRFEVRGRSPVVGIEAELPLPVEDPFRQDEAACRVDRDPGQTRVVRTPSRRPGKGTLTLHLRHVDLADVFQVLQLLTSQTFLVDGDLSDRVSIDLNRVTLDQGLQALEKLGLHISANGPARFVSRTRPAAPPVVPEGDGGAKVSFALKRAPVREILAVMTEVDPALAALGPEGHLGRVSVWADDAPVAHLRTIILDAVGLTERIENDRRILERRSGEPVFPVAGTPRDRRLVTRPQDLALLDFELAGVASAGAGWTAFAYSPRGLLQAFRSGDALLDATIKAVHSNDVVLETGAGPFRIGLPR